MDRRRRDLDLAADIAHRVDPAEDQPLCDLLRISHRAGNDLDARSWAQLLLQTNGVESPEDLPNLDSYLTVHEVFPRGLRTAAAVGIRMRNPARSDTGGGRTW